jgi:hypothetical protein
MKRIAVFVTCVFLAVGAGTGQVPGLGQVPARPITPAESNSPVGSNALAGGIVASRPNLPQMASAGEMIGFSHVDGSGNLTITLVHTGKSWMSVYHVDSKGTIRLASSRPIDADFTLQLNATDPLPEDIRQMADRVSAGR